MSEIANGGFGTALHGTRRARCAWGAARIPNLAPVLEMLSWPPVLLALLLVALWPTWAWYARRMVDGSDEPWGLAALAAVLVLVWGQREAIASSARPRLLLAGAGSALLAALGAPWLPALLRAALGISALALSLGAVLDRRRPLLPLWALLLLALPVTASLQFYLGHPMRGFTAWASQGLLAAAGLEVSRAGVTLSWAGKQVLVDAPCSGVQMLWTGMFLNALLSYLQRASALRFLVNTTATLALVLLGNALRNTLLFVKEAGIVTLPAWTHGGIGLVAFLMTAMAIAAVVRSRRPTPAAVTARRPEPSANHAAAAGFVAVVLCAALLPLGWKAGEPTPGRRTTAVVWPATFEGRPLESVPLTPVEERFIAQFPGAVARFSDGRRQLIMRSIDAPTRLLHPAADCYRGLGYEVNDTRVVAADDRTHWGCFTASRNGRSLDVCERIHDQAGRTWTDVSSWYWDALLGRSEGPWIAVAVAGGV